MIHRTGFFVAYMIYFQPEWLGHPLISAVGPVVVAVVLAFVINKMFMNVFIVTLDTIMLCNCEDKQSGTDHGKSNTPQEAAVVENSAPTQPVQPAQPIQVEMTKTDEEEMPPPAPE